MRVFPLPNVEKYLSAFARDRALADDELARIVEALGIIRISAKDAVIGLGPATWLQLRRALLATLEATESHRPSGNFAQMDDSAIMLELRAGK